MFPRFVRSGLTAVGFVILLAGGSPSPVVADVDVTGQLRVRYEGDDRSFVDGAQFEHVVLQRTRLTVSATNDDGAEVVIEAQDSRAWGEEGNTLADTEGVDIHQAYARLEDPFGLMGTDFFVGRQEIAYGSHRIFGDTDWENAGRAFDAALLRIHIDENWLDIGSGRVSDRNFAPGGEHEIFVYAYGHYTAPGDDVEFAFEPMVLYRDVDTQGIFQTTVGQHANLHTGRLHVYQDFYYQLGEARVGDIDAYLFAADVAADLSGRADESFGLGAGFALLTGDDPSDDKDSPFDTIYQTGHRHYGWMDIAQAVAGANGLRDFHVKGWAKTANDLWFKAAFHTFRTDIDRSVSGSDVSDIGKELDLKIKKDMDEGMALEVGGGLFLPGDIVDGTLGEETAYWAYVQGTTEF